MMIIFVPSPKMFQLNRISATFVSASQNGLILDGEQNEWQFQPQSHGWRL